MIDLLQSLFLVTGVGILLGAGLPALFSLSIHFLSPSGDGTAASGGRRALGWIFLAIVLVAVAAHCPRAHRVLHRVGPLPVPVTAKLLRRLCTRPGQPRGLFHGHGPIVGVDKLFVTT